MDRVKVGIGAQRSLEVVPRATRVTERLLDHSCVEVKEGIACAQHESTVHRNACLQVPVNMVKRPCDQIVTVNVTSRPKLSLRVGEHLGAAQPVIEKEKTPGAMIRARLSCDSDFHRAEVIVGGGGIADCGVRVADSSERRWIELDRYCVLAEADGITWSIFHRRQGRHCRKQSIVVWLDCKTALKQGPRGAEATLTHLDITGAKVKPRHLLLRQISA